MDVSRKTALQALVHVSALAELELFRSKYKSSPLMHVLLAARRDAIDAMKGLVNVDPADTEGVRKLQNEVQRFFDILTFTQGILDGGEEAIAELEPGEIEELRELLLTEAQQGGDGE